MNIESIDLERRVAMHMALGDAARLRIVDALSIGDLAPSEIQTWLDVSSNLLAHHLGVLEGAGLIERSRSEADRRRTYIRLAAGAHGLVGAGRIDAPQRVVFVCTANSARSQIAAALWQRESSIPATSAGTHPAPAIAQGALDVAERRGLDLPRSAPRSIESVRDTGDWVITVCDAAHEELGGEDAAHWSVSDPGRASTPAAYDDAYDELADRIRAVVPHFVLAG